MIILSRVKKGTQSVRPQLFQAATILEALTQYAAVKFFARRKLSVPKVIIAATITGRYVTMICVRTAQKNKLRR